ncbi:MAG: hypothetical protein ACRDKZ_08235 [Actinomycetota bacterium]
MILAHGVGRVYESPLPLALYLLGAAATVAASFLLRALVGDTRPLGHERRLAGTTFSLVAGRVLRFAGVLLLALTVLSGAFTAEQGISLAPLLFWVGLIVGSLVLQAVVEGAWARSDPWIVMVRAVRSDDASGAGRELPWWVGPAGIYLLFWFELVFPGGFDAFWIVVALLIYSLFVLTLRPQTNDERWAEADPLHILFGFAGRCAPFRVDDDGLYYRGALRGLDEPGPMPRALYWSVFVLLASTTLDNVRETVGWSELRGSVGLASAPDMLIDSIALAAFTLLFLAPFLATVWLAQRFVSSGLDFHGTARRFGWSLIPIGVAYVLAHNAPLVLTSIPLVLRGLSDPLGRGWNLLGTGNALQGFFPSPALVWFLEIALIVGGHILGVLAAHRTAVRLGRSHTEAVKSQYALTVLMSLFTITTLWLLSQPLVA